MFFQQKKQNHLLMKTYILNQKEHHKKTTFKEEYRTFLKEYVVDYDERYVWD